MNRTRAINILNILEENYPKAGIILKYSNNFELLVSVMLSAQTTDIQVNKVTSTLFPKYQKKWDKFKYEGNNLKNVEVYNFANVELSELEKDIGSVGLFRSKAKNIRETANIILNEYKGAVPNSMDKLVKLPGVGRKTANVVLGNAFKIYEGVAVDTHVKKQSFILGFTKETNPEKIEKDLMKLFPKNDWFRLTYLLIEHGRQKRNISFF